MSSFSSPESGQTRQSTSKRNQPVLSRHQGGITSENTYQPGPVINISFRPVTFSHYTIKTKSLDSTRFHVSHSVQSIKAETLPPEAFRRRQTDRPAHQLRPTKAEHCTVHALHAQGTRDIPCPTRCLCIDSLCTRDTPAPCLQGSHFSTPT